jgi:hypothetical protein
MNSRFWPTLAGGLVIGILSSLPAIKVCNCFCCLWVILGGGLAVWLHEKYGPPGATSLGAMWTGWLAGMWGTLFSTLASAITFMIFGAASAMNDMQFQFQQTQDIPGFNDAMQQFLSWMTGPYGMLLGILGTFGASLFFYSIFAPLGGMVAHTIGGGNRPVPPLRSYQPPIEPSQTASGDYQI